MGFIIAPGGRWTANDKVGQAAIGALLYTYRNQTREPKNTYADAGGLVLNPNPITLDASGSATIFWEDDEYYTIQIFSVLPSDPTVPYELIYSEDNYPAVNGGSSGDIVINQSFPNLARNPQFTRWGNNNYLSSNNANDTEIRLDQGTVYDVDNTICDDWCLLRNNTNSTITLSRQQFPLGQFEVPANPVNYLRYECTGVGGGGETQKAIFQTFQGVQTLSNTQVSAGIWARSSSSSPLTMYIRQSYGTGGSPSADTFTTLIDVSLTSVWTQYTATEVLGSVAGKTLGTNFNNLLSLEIGLPLNAVGTIDICNVQLHTSADLPDFAYLPINDQLKRTDTTGLYPQLPTGSVITGIFNTAPNGWILCNDSTIGSAFSGSSYASNDTLNLYILLWSNVGNALAPILDSSGATTTRGSTAIADFNANKRLTLTRTLGRAIGASGAGSGLTSRPLGTFTGSETVALVAANNGPHTHTYSQLVSGTPHTIDSSGDAAWHFTTSNTGSSGSGTPHQNMQPTIFLTTMIKL